MLDGLKIARPQSLRQQIRDELRQAIVSGRFAPGTRLPSTHDLAKQWNSQSSNVHAALATLVKEGLLVRKSGVGTVVTDWQDRLQRVALYSVTDTARNPARVFERAVLSELSTEYARRGIEVESIVDTRSAEEQTRPLPLLAKAASDRRIQALAGVGIKVDTVKWLQKLPVIGAFVSVLKMSNAVQVDNCEFIQRSLEILRDRGIRRVGLISNYFSLSRDNMDETPYEEFCAKVDEWGMETRPSWVRAHAEGLPEENFEQYGHQAFKELWNEADKPDGLVVFTDFVARGVLHGILDVGVSVPDDLRLVLHRNAEIPYYCPVPATFVEMSVHRVALALIDLLDRQFRGEKVQSVTVPFSVNREAE